MIEATKDVHEYELGAWHPELGNYESWYDSKMEDFKLHYEVVAIDQYPTSTGGIGLIVHAYKKESQ